MLNVFFSRGFLQQITFLFLSMIRWSCLRIGGKKSASLWRNQNRSQFQTILLFPPSIHFSHKASPSHIVLKETISRQMSAADSVFCPSFHLYSVCSDTRRQKGFIPLQGGGWWHGAKALSYCIKYRPGWVIKFTPWLQPAVRLTWGLCVVEFIFRVKRDNTGWSVP